jgi:hypothetical protein
MLLPVFGWAFVFNWTEIAQRNAVGLFQIILSLLLVAAVVSYFRMVKRGEDFAKSIYDLFFSFYREEASGKAMRS